MTKRPRGAGPRFDRLAQPHPLTHDAMVVSRRASAGRKQMTALTGDPVALSTSLPGKHRFLMGPMTPSSGFVGTTWNGEGQFRRTGIIRRPVRVTVEITSWSDDGGEVRISPRSKRFPQWGARRMDRYFRLAHAAADHLRRVLHQPDPAASDAERPGGERPDAERILTLEGAT